MLKDRLIALVKVGLPGLALLLIVRALATDGANSAAGAASLGAGLSVVALAVACIADREDLRRFWRRDRWTVVCFALLVVYAMVTLIPLPLVLDNPIYRDLGLPSGARSIAPYRGLEGLAALTGPAAAFVVGALLSPTRKDRDRTALLILLAAAIFLLTAFGRYVASLGEGETRLAAGVGANGACTVMFMLAVIGAGDVIRRLGQKPSRKRTAAISLPKVLRGFEVSPLGMAVLILAVVGALLTQSRAGLASGAAGFLVLFLLSRSPQQKASGGVRQVILIVGSALGVALLLVLAEYAIGRFSGAVGEDFAMRWAIVHDHWRAFLGQPITGHGLNSFHEVNAHLANPATWAATHFVGATHNVWVQWLEETGLVGAILMALMVGRPLLQAWSASRNSSSARVWGAAAIVVAVVCGLHGLFDFGLYIPAVAALFGFILGAFGQPLAAPTETRAPRASASRHGRFEDGVAGAGPSPDPVAGMGHLR